LAALAMSVSLLGLALVRNALYLRVIPHGVAHVRYGPALSTSDPALSFALISEDTSSGKEKPRNLGEVAGLEVREAFAARPLWPRPWAGARG